MWSLIIEYQIVQQTHRQRNRKQKVKPSYNQINPAGNRSSHFHRSHGLNSEIERTLNKTISDINK